MQLLHDSWLRWWAGGPAADVGQLCGWADALGLTGPSNWRWQPIAARYDEVLKHSPNSSAGTDGLPYAAWKALRRDAPRCADGRPSWIAEYLAELTEGMASAPAEDVPADMNELLCHVVGKPPQTLAPDGSLRRGPEDTRVIEVGSTENRLLARGVCYTLTRETVGEWLDADQFAWLPDRHALQAVVKVDLEQRLAF